MIMRVKQAALAEGAIMIRYTGPFAYASAKLTVSSPAAPVLQVGVSDTSLAAAAAAVKTVITGDGTLTHRDVVAAVNAWYDTTAATEVKQGEFEVEMLHSLETDVFGGTTSPYAADAGTSDNLKNTWVNKLIIDNDADDTGYVSVRLPDPELSKGPVAIRTGTPTITRSIYKGDGTLVWSLGSVATATGALLAVDFEEPVIVADGPVVVRDTAATPAHMTETTMAVMYGYPSGQNLV